MRQCGLEKNQWHLVAVYGARWPATTASFSMADTAASTQSRTTRASSTKRRANTVSTETENKLARAARSAQRLAQLSDASRDDSTLDMFPDDPTRATLEAMNIDIRQGTLHGFELPDVVLAAVGGTTSLEAAVSASSDTRAARRAPREKVEPAYAAVPLDGFERFEPTQKVSVPKDEPSNAVGLSGAALEATNGPAMKRDVQTTSLPVSLGLVSPSMAAASLVRSVTARRQVADPLTEPTTAGKPGGVPPQRVAETLDKAAMASREGVAVSGEALDGAAAASATAAVKPALDDGVRGDKAKAGEAKASAGVSAATLGVAGVTGVAGASTVSGITGSAATAGAATTARVNAPSVAPASTVSTPSGASTASGSSTPSSMAAKAEAARAPTAAARPNAPFATPLQDTAPTVPELDRARATAFADTVDALYGVISDQRRAATDHSRRMKWMLSIVVGALLATVAIGITQTVLLMRLTRETTAQQHRIEQLMQNQQAAMTSLLDAHLAVANAAANAPSAAPSGASAPVVAPRAPAIATAASPASKHKAHAHAHKPKAAPTH
jgi:hypothetical protein